MATTDDPTPSAHARTQGAPNPSNGRPRRIDAYSHFSPPKYLEFTERVDGPRPPPTSREMLMAKPALIDVRERIAFMDRHEVDIHVLVPVPWLEGFPKIASDRALARQAARLMNDEIAAVVASHPNRFRGVALLPTIDPEDMLAELHRAVTELGFVGAYLPVGPTAKRTDHRDFEPLYRTIVELDATLWLHPSRPATRPDYIDEDVSKFFEWQSIGWLQDTASAMYRIVFSGVFDRYPSIRIVTHHHGALVPIFAPRLQACWDVFEYAGMYLPTKVSRPYIEHFRKFHCDTAALGYAPKVFEIVLDFLGPQHMMFGTDSPMDASGGHHSTAETLRAIDAMSITPEVRRGILAGNAMRTLKIA